MEWGRRYGRREIAQPVPRLDFALDRRLPQVQRTGEKSIAVAARQLRSEAVKRIAEIERTVASA